MRMVLYELVDCAGFKKIIIHCIDHALRVTKTHRHIWNLLIKKVKNIF